MTVPRFHVLLLALGALLSSAGCGGDGNGPSKSVVHLSSIAPEPLPPGSGPFTLVVIGSGFMLGSSVQWGSADRFTTFVNQNRLTAEVLPADVLQAGTVRVTVRNPDGAHSNSLTFHVTAGAAPFQVDSIRPRPGSEVNVGQPILIYFNQAVDPSSLNDSTLRFTEGATGIPATITYQSQSHAAQLLPQFAASSSYALEISDLIRSTTGSGLFLVNMSLPVPFFTPYATIVTVAPDADWVSIGIGTDGAPRVGLRSISPSLEAHAALAACTANCLTQAGWTVTQVDPGGLSGGYMSIVVTGAAQANLAYEDAGGGSLIKYFGSGPRLTLDSDNKAWTAIAASATGRLHLVYYDGNGGDIRHATCAANCTSLGNWSLSLADATGNSGGYSSVAVDPSGNVHVVYLENTDGDLRYATCPSECAAPSWTTGVVDSVGLAGYGNSLKADANGRLHLSTFNNTSGMIRYGTCAAGCTVRANWTLVDIGPGTTKHALALGSNGEINIVYHRSGDGFLQWARCSFGCTSSSNWTEVTLSRRGPASDAVSLAVRSDGSRHVVWGFQGLQYMSF